MSNFSSIGFPVSTGEQMNDMCARAIPMAQPVDTALGHYLRYAEPSGAELWIQRDRSGDIIGMNPHFSGPSIRTFSLVRAIDNPDHILDGGFYGWANPSDNTDPETGDYPYVFDCPDYRTGGAIAVPQTLSIQLSAFAHEIEIYADEDDYNANDDDELSLASEAFIPTGLFIPEDAEEGIQPQAFGLFTGKVLQAQTHTTDLQNASFSALQVSTLGGELDLVIDPQLVDGCPQIEAYVKVSSWLSGQVISTPKPAPGASKKLFGLFRN